MNTAACTRQYCLSVDLGKQLLGSVEPIRRVIQDDCNPGSVVTRGDVVRLALRLLILRVLRVQVERGENASGALDWWAQVAGELTADPATPEWAGPPRLTYRRPVRPSPRKGARNEATTYARAVCEPAP